MSLNIKNEETHRLARELAQLTGESVTAAVTEAVRQRLERVREQRGGPSRYQRLRAIARDCAAHLTREAKAIDHGELLYGEDGLPR